MAKRRSSIGDTFENFSKAITRFTGSTAAFGIALGVILVWAVVGPLFGYSDTWQLLINTGTTIVTFLMVFLIQRSQNKDSLAIHLKLNEIVAAMQGASNRLIDVEDLSEKELGQLCVEPLQRGQLLRRRGPVGEGAGDAAGVLRRAGEAGARRDEDHRVAFGRRGARAALVEAGRKEQETQPKLARMSAVTSGSCRTGARRRSRAREACASLPADRLSTAR